MLTHADQKRLSIAAEPAPAPPPNYAVPPVGFQPLLSTPPIAPDLCMPAPARGSPGLLPPYIKPLPSRMAMEDAAHLARKGALSIPETSFRNELIRSYVEYVHPYMPLIDLHDFLRAVDKGTGESGRVSLLLFQAVMFTGVAFVDMSYLTAAGYATRKAARKAFYVKARVCSLRAIVGNSDDGRSSTTSTTTPIACPSYRRCSS